jgi:hypothetical protein
VSVDLGPVLPYDLDTGGQLRCQCREPATPTFADWWLCSAGHEFRGPRHEIQRREPAVARPIRRRFGFYEIETSFPVPGTWIRTELQQTPMVWGRRRARRKAERILARESQ